MGFAEALALYATKEGHEVKVAASRHDALMLFRQGFHPNAILVDLKLQTDMGDSFIRTLQPQEFGRHRLAVVAITADPLLNPELPPGVPLIRKPSDPDDILATLRAVAEQSSDGIPVNGGT